MYLFFDTETTGLPRNWNVPVSDLDNWPRLVQIAWLLFDAEGKMLRNQSHIIRPDGFSIPHEAASVHGITTERALEQGVGLGEVLSEFSALASVASFLVAHNISFDEKIIGAEFLRMGEKDFLPSKKRICTMKQSTEFCRLPGPYGYKWPKLSELHRVLFDESVPDAHDAGKDIAVCAKCFWELRGRGVL